MRKFTTVGRKLFIRVWPYAAFFVVLLVMSLPQGAQTLTTFAELPLTAGSQAASSALGYSDAGSLLKAATSLFENHALYAEQFWVYNYWPPGMVVVDTGLLALEAATGLSIVSLMVVLNAVVWALLLGASFGMVRRRRGVAVAGLFGVGAVVYSGISRWGVDTGLFYSDSFGAAAFCAAILCLIRADESVGRVKIRFAVLAGVLLATAAYFRATFELLDNALFVLSAAAVLLILVLRWRHIAPRAMSRAVPVALPLLIASATYLILSLPWRLVAVLKIRPGDPRWSTVSDTISPSRWRPDSTLTGGASFLEQGHVNWACELDPVECKRIASLELPSADPYTGHGYFTNAQFDQMTVKTALSHPFEFLGERFSTLWLGMGTETGSVLGVWAVPETLIILSLLVALIVAFFRRGGFRSAAFVLFALATAVQLGTLLLVHVESRYFLGVELSIIIMAALVIGRQPTPTGESQRSVDTASASSAAP